LPEWFNNNLGIQKKPHCIMCETTKIATILLWNIKSSRLGNHRAIYVTNINVTIMKVSLCLGVTINESHAFWEEEVNTNSTSCCTES
jgi:hypothetical protein